MFPNFDIQAVIIATGNTPKMALNRHTLTKKLLGKELILHQANIFFSNKIKTTIVIRHEDKDALTTLIENKYPNYFTFVIIKKNHGSGNAFLATSKHWDSNNIFVSFAHMPLLDIKLLLHLYHSNKKIVHTFLENASSPNNSHPLFSYTDILNDQKLTYLDDKIKCKNPINNKSLMDSGVYIFKKEFLNKHEKTLSEKPFNSTCNMSDIINLALQKEAKQTIAITSPSNDAHCLLPADCVNNFDYIEKFLQHKVIENLKASGVIFERNSISTIDVDVEIGKHTTIAGNTTITAGTKIGKNCSIKDAIIENSTIEDNVTIKPHSVIYNSIIKKNSIVGPFAHVHSKSEIGPNAQIGNFVEVKNSIIGNSSKAKHLAYIGDTTAESNVNFGAGNVVCNFDGKKKHKTIIKKNAFIGSNSTLIAPIKIEENAFIAAGSTITQDVPANSLAIARKKQENKADYTKKVNLNKKTNCSSKKEGKAKKNDNDAYFIPAQKTFDKAL